ncbi:transposase [Streptomyces sp. 900105245]
MELLAPLISSAVRGRPRVEDRRVVNGMLYRIRTQTSARDPPERYGLWQTVCTRFRRFAWTACSIGLRSSCKRRRTRPETSIGSSRAYLRKRGIACTNPEKTDQQRHRHNRGRHGGRPPALDQQIYRRRTSSNATSKASAASSPYTTRPPPHTRQRLQ